MVAVGCVAPPQETWVRTSSRHFDLIGAMPEKDAETFVAMLERFRTALLGIVFSGRLKHPDRIVVVVADRLSKYSRTMYLGGTATNASVAPLGVSEVLIVDGEIAPRAQLELTAKHELTHAITLPYAPGMPYWYSEGLAGIFETVDIDRKRGVVRLGHWDRRHQRYRYRPLSLDVLFDWHAPVWEEASNMQYATAIQLLQMLQLRYPGQLAAFEAGMHEGMDWVEAWTKAFGERRTIPLSQELQAFTFKETTPPSAHGVSIDLRTPAVIQSRAARDAEAHAARALLYALAQGRRTEAQSMKLANTELEAALSAEDPEAMGLIAAALLYDANPDTRAGDVEITRLRRALARTSSNWQAAVLLARTKVPLAERAEALERAGFSHPNQPYLLAERAHTKLEQGDAHAALELARAASKGAPESFHVTAIYLDVLAANEICDRDVLTKALATATSPTATKQVTTYAERHCAGK
jgi:hypothetical protein